MSRPVLAGQAQGKADRVMISTSTPNPPSRPEGMEALPVRPRETSLLKAG
jgi:hypothetical protein